MAGSSPTQVKERSTRALERFEVITKPEEAQAQVASLPLVAVHEARYAIQQLKEEIGSDPQMFEILEPISRIVGWVEACSYFLDVTTQRDAVKTMLAGGLLSSASQNSK